MWDTEELIEKIQKLTINQKTLVNKLVDELTSNNNAGASTPH